MGHCRLSNTGNQVVSSAVVYNIIGTGLTTSSNTTTELNSEMLFLYGGLFNNLLINCTAHTTNTTALSRTNAANGVLTVSVTAIGLVEDTTHIDSDVVNDKKDIHYSAVSISVEVTAVTFSTWVNTAVRGFAGASPATALAGGTTYYQPFAGVLNLVNTTETSVNSPVTNIAGILQHLTINVTAVSGSPSGAITSRENTANGNLTVTAAAVGFLSDTTHIDSVAAGTNIDSQSVITGSSTTLSTSYIAMDYTTPETATTNPTVGGGQLFSVDAQNAAVNSGGTGDGSMSFPLDNTASVTLFEVTARDAYVCSDFTEFIASNTSGTGTCTSSLILNGSTTGNETFTIGTGASGTFTDSTHTDSVTATTDVTHNINTQASAVTVCTGFSIVWQYSAESFFVSWMPVSLMVPF
jgi:hypothetical protein